MLAGTENQKTLGDDGGCFAAAVAAVRRWGGVLEHPEASHAWAAHGIPKPPKSGGWIFEAVHAGGVGVTCCVEQGHYGHRARKATWLYYVGANAPPDLTWGPAQGCARLDDGYHSAAERAASTRAPVERLGKTERRLTPPAFAAVLVSLARGAR